MARPLSDRAFGARLVGLVLVLAFWPWLSDQPMRRFFLGAAAALALLTALRPERLTGGRRLGERLEQSGVAGMRRTFSVLAYVLVVLPCALLARCLGRDALGGRFEREATTYWAPYSGAADGSELRHPY